MSASASSAAATTAAATAASVPMLEPMIRITTTTTVLEIPPSALSDPNVALSLRHLMPSAMFDATGGDGTPFIWRKATVECDSKSDGGSESGRAKRKTPDTAAAAAAGAHDLKDDKVEDDLFVVCSKCNTPVRPEFQSVHDARHANGKPILPPRYTVDHFTPNHRLYRYWRAVESMPDVRPSFNETEVQQSWQSAVTRAWSKFTRFRSLLAGYSVTFDLKHACVLGISGDCRPWKEEYTNCVISFDGIAGVPGLRPVCQTGSFVLLTGSTPSPSASPSLSSSSSAAAASALPTAAATAGAAATAAGAAAHDLKDDKVDDDTFVVCSKCNVPVRPEFQSVHDARHATGRPILPPRYTTAHFTPNDRLYQNWRSVDSLRDLPSATSRPGWKSAVTRAWSKFTRFRTLLAGYLVTFDLTNARVLGVSCDCRPWKPEYINCVISFDGIDGVAGLQPVCQTDGRRADASSSSAAASAPPTAAAAPGGTAAAASITSTGTATGDENDTKSNEKPHNGFAPTDSAL